MLRMLKTVIPAAVLAAAALAGAATAQTTKPLDVLPDYSQYKLKLWDWSSPMAPSQWSEPKLGGYVWRADHAAIVNGKLNLSVSEKASAQVQANTSTAMKTGYWEVDTTLPPMRDGLVAAPLWMFNAGTSDEIDFEVLGRKGMQLTVWSAVKGKHTAVWSKRVMWGDLSGRRLRLGIAYDAGKSIRYYINGKLVATVLPKDAPLGFPSTPVKSYFDLWVANGVHPGWVGKWTPLRANQRLTMVIHGYRAGTKLPA